MKAIQSVVYAFSGINIFAKATASSMKSTTSNAKKASKSLAGVHNEINNVSKNDSENNGSATVSPNMDLSKIDNTPNSIIEAIKNGDWNQIGVTIGEKLNESMSKINWAKIQNTARTIGTNIAQFLNGFIGTTDWNQVGNTFAQGLNTVIYFAYDFVTTFDWSQYGTAIGEGINGFINNIDWATLAQTLSNYVIGAFTYLSSALQAINWQQIAKDLSKFITNIDWSGVAKSLFTALGSALGGIAAFIGQLLMDAWTGIKEYFGYWIDEAEKEGASVVEGILVGILNALMAIGEWIYFNMIEPIISAFCEMLGIHSPSTVFSEFGKNIVQGLLEGIRSLINNITELWNKIKDTAVEIFNNIKTKISDIWNNIKNTITTVITNIKTNISNIWNNIMSTISTVITNIKNKVTTVFNNIKNAIVNAFNTVKTKISSIWNSIWSTIKGIINKIIGGVEKLVNTVIKGINKIIKPLTQVGNKILSAVGIKNFSFSAIPTVSLPRLATGNVAYEETVAVFGEYSGARNNPEITTPQNIMYDTMRRALSDSGSSENNGNAPINISLIVSKEKLGEILLSDLRNMKRRSGKNIEALVGG